MKEDIKIVSGKRKRAVARAAIKTGSGKVKINGKGINCLNYFDRLKMEEPLRIAEKIIGNLSFDVEIKTQGGGEKGQIDASRLALARAISNFVSSKELTEAFFDYDRNLLIADVRRKETNKPGDSKARAKRQTSYR